MNNSVTNKTLEVNEEYMDTIELWIAGIISVIVVFLGLIGNFLTVVVLTRRVMHSSTNTYLTGLAIWDMMVLVGTLMLMTLPKLSPTFEECVGPYIIAYIYPLALVAQTSTVWITVSFTVERYIAVCYPLRATTWCTITRARSAIIGVSICAVLFNICRWFEWELQTDNQNSNKTCPLKADRSEFSKILLFKKVYYFYMYPIFMLIVPLTILAVLNTFLVMAVKRSRHQQRTMNVRQFRENNVTIMLVSVVVVFMICQIPALVYNVAYAIDETAASNLFGWKVLSQIRNFLVTFNSSINFILYCAFGQKFRCIFIRTFCQWILGDARLQSLSSAHTAHVATRINPNKYTSAIKVKRSPCFEMSETQQTHLSRYSPCISRSPSPQSIGVTERRQTNGIHRDLHPNMDYTCKSRLLPESPRPDSSI